MNDWPIHKYIPMEKLDLIQPTQVRILNYINPQRFYVYLQEKVNTLTKSQSNLQAVMNANPFHSSSYERDQAIAVLDDHSVWLRATVSELLPIASQQLRAYFVDSGDEQIVSLVNVRPLPKEFTSQSALAIPCRLYGIYPLADTWQVDDPVHAIFGSLMKNYANCKVCERKDQFYYEVDIDIPNIGNLGTYLFEQKLVSSRQIRSMNTISPAPFIEPVIRSDIPSLPLKDGIYIITHVYSAIEFYGHSLVRQRELNALHRHLETIYNLNQTNEQSLSVPLIVEGIGCVIQQGEQYHRVIIKHRESDTRVLVKLVDRGDELPVDISELLQLEQRYLTIPAFAQPFRLANYDDSQSTTTITRKFKRLMLNQSVQITQTSPAIKGFFPVRVQLADNSIVNDILLTNDPIPPVEISKPSIPERNRFGTRSPRPPPPVRFFREPRKINLDEIEQPKRTFSGWPNARPMPTVHFQAADSYKQIDFPRQTFDFVISHIENLTDFFIQLTCKELELNQLTDDLQKEHIRAPELSTNQLKPYQPCLAKSPLDDCWYRALILSNSQTDIRIRFIDFGDTHQIDFKSIRQLADKFALVSPYAYHCTLTNPQFEHLKFDKDEMISKCIGQIFRGKFDGQTKEKIFILRSETFERLFSNSKRVSCLIVHIDHDRNQFYIQDDRETMNKIKSEISMADNFPREENLQLKSFVIATYENQPYRARIEQIQGDNVEVYFIDYGNRTRCSKTSLKQCPNQLKTYRSQAKCCQLEDDDDVYLKKLDEIQDSDEIQVIYLNKINEIYTVQLFINQECLTNLSLQSTATTVKERKRTNDEILSPTNSLTNIKRQKSQSETYRGILTHIDKKKKLVFFQLQPEAEKKLEDINEIIDEIVQMNQHNERYSIDDYVIAQFSEDNEYYRAKIESYSSETNTYSVYFLDYGNIDENVPINRLFPYSSRLNQFANQVRSYKLESYVWPDELSSLLNQELEFDLIDHDLSIISIKCLLKSQPKTLTANLCSTNQNSFYVHLLPDADALICEIDELLETHEREQQDVHQWKLNDLCMIFDSNENRYFRGRIQAIRNQLFDIQCIDYGNLLSNVSNQQMFVLKNPFLLEQKPLARQCRLYGVNDENQSKAIDEVIRLIPLTEQLTLTVDNQQNDTQCMFVMLFRNNKEIINDRYIEINQRTHSNNSSDSAIAADDESSSHEQQISSPIGSPQAESTHRYVDTITNQTIDFGENDPNTTIKDENNILES